MAVLEKIRKRSVLLFIIIIGALLAFILGDFLNSGRSLFGPGDTVAKVGNAKVKQMDLNKKSDDLENQVKNARANGQQIPQQYADPDFRYNQALNQALYEQLLIKECERLGIEVTDEFITKFVNNPQTAMVVWQNLMGEMGANPQESMAYLQSKGIVDPVTYLDAIEKPSRYGLQPQEANAFAAVWKNMENSIAQSIEFDLYNQMLQSMIVPNKADAKANFVNQNNLATVQVASLPLSTVKDSEIKLEKADYDAVYNKTKDAYRILDENREVAYILVPIEASQADNALAEAETSALREELKNSEGIEAVLNHTGFSQRTVKISANELKNNREYAWLKSDSSASLTKGSVHTNMGIGKKTLAKVLDVTTGIDKVVFDFFPAPSQQVADSLFADKSVAAVDSVIKAQTNGQYVDLTTSLISPNQTLAPFIDSPKVIEGLQNATLNQYYAVNDTINGQPYYAVMLVKERDAAVPAYEIAKMEYEIFPSDKTRQDLAQKLHNYVANHPTAQKFVNDTTGEFFVQYTMLNPNSVTLDNAATTPGTRSIVKWAMDAKKGAVSPVFTRQKTIYGDNGQPDQSKEYLVAVAVVDVYNDYLPVTSHLVQEGLKPQVMNNKKGKILVDKYTGKGKTIGEYAQAMGVTPQEQKIAFGAGTIGGQAQGELAAAKKGQLVGPVQGAREVYVFQVDEVEAPDFNASDLKTRIQEAASSMRRPQIGPAMLIGNRKVTNNSLMFVGDPTAE